MNHDPIQFPPTPLECVLISLKSLEANLDRIQFELASLQIRTNDEVVRVQRTIQALEDSKWPPATPQSETNSSSD